MPSYRWPTYKWVVAIQVGHFSRNPSAHVSEGGVLAVVVRDFPKMAHQTQNGKHFPRPLRNSDARLRLACPLPSPVPPCEAGTAGPAPQRVVPGSQPTQCNTLGLARGSGPFEPPTGESSPVAPHHPRLSLLSLP